MSRDMDRGKSVDTPQTQKRKGTFEDSAALRVSGRQGEPAVRADRMDCVLGDLHVPIALTRREALMSSNVLIKVMVVDDHPVVREWLRVALNGSCGMEVVGEARDGSRR